MTESRTDLICDENLFENLRDHADDPEESRSSYWDEQIPKFSVDERGIFTGASAAGTVSDHTGALHTMAHWLLQLPWRHFGRRYARFSEFEAIGRQLAHLQERQFTEDMIRQVLAVSAVDELVDLADPRAASCVIGDGYGVLSALLAMKFPNRKIITVNLRKTLLADMTFIARALPEAVLALARTPGEMKSAYTDEMIDVIAVQADNAECISSAPVGAAFNICSMQEMAPEVIARYFHILRSNQADRTMFYCCNSLRKVLPGKIVNEFFNYPWHERDEVLLDEICPWLNYAYSSRPPFWHRKTEISRCQHRLANLEHASKEAF